MKKVFLGRSRLEVPRIAIGVMHINRLNETDAERFINACLEKGCNFFDHADVYGSDKAQFGRCEEIFAKASHMCPTERGKYIIQDKIGFEPPIPGSTRSERLNSSKDYIIKATNDSLKRLKTEYLDVLLLHAPDALTEPEDIAEAFRILKDSGKVRYFGVSNYNTLQLMLLEKYMEEPIVADQLCLSVMNSGLLSHGMYVNMDETELSIERSGDVLNYCRLKDITIECWSTMQYNGQQGTFIGNPKFPELNRILNEIGGNYGISPSGVAMAWILRHPAHFIPITGTMNIQHLEENLQGTEIELTRKEWYDIWAASGNFLR